MKPWLELEAVDIGISNPLTAAGAGAAGAATAGGAGAAAADGVEGGSGVLDDAGEVGLGGAGEVGGCRLVERRRVSAIGGHGSHVEASHVHELHEVVAEVHDLVEDGVVVDEVAERVEAELLARGQHAGVGLRDRALAIRRCRAGSCMS